MFLVRILMAVVLAGGALAPSMCNAALYRFERFSGFQPGWSFDGGTITTRTDFFGDITASNVGEVITDWSVSFTTPGLPSTEEHYTLTSSNSLISYFDGVSTNLRVDTAEILFPGDQIEIGLETLQFSSLLALATIQFSPSLVAIFDGSIGSGSDSSLIVTSPPTTIAVAVPEPGAFSLIATLAFVFSLLRSWPVVHAAGERVGYVAHLASRGSGQLVAYKQGKMPDGDLSR